MNHEDLSSFVEHQLINIFNYSDCKDKILAYQTAVMSKLKKCFIHVANNCFSNNGEITFSPFHSSQYSIYLYFLSNIIYKNEGENPLSERLYLLNKALHSVDWFYPIELPDIFVCEHPVGSVLGRAIYSNYFCVFQNCTVGGNMNKYPKIGEYVTLCAGSMIIGDCDIGNNVIVSAGTLILNQNIPDNSIVFGRPRDIVIKKKSREEIKELLRDMKIWK